MKRAFSIWAMAAFVLCAPALAADDTSVVDLTGLDTDQPVQSPSFENTTPAGQAPGGPIEDNTSNE